MIEDKQKALAVGMNDHLSKPINRPELLACLQQWLDNRQQVNNQAATPQTLGLIVHSDPQTIKALAQEYKDQMKILVANNTHKAESLLLSQEQIRRVLLEAQWQDLKPAWEEKFNVKINIIH